jgi:phage-related holin
MVVVIALQVIKNATVIRLKVPTQLAKTIEEVKQWLNDASSRLNPKN